MHYVNVHVDASFGFTEDDVKHDKTEGALRADVREKVHAALAGVEGLEVHDVIIDGWVN